MLDSWDVKLMAGHTAQKKDERKGDGEEYTQLRISLRGRLNDDRVRARKYSAAGLDPRHNPSPQKSLNNINRNLLAGCNVHYARSHLTFCCLTIEYFVHSVPQQNALPSLTQKNLQHHLQWVLYHLLQLPNPFTTNSTINNLVIKAASDNDLIIPLRDCSFFGVQGYGHFSCSSDS